MSVLYYLDQDQVNALESALLSPTSPTPYADVYQLVFGYLHQSDYFGTNPPGDVAAWFGAAAQTNAGVGGASDFIRTYTLAQIAIRTGSVPTAVDTILQASSDAIAQRVYDDIVDAAVVINGENYYLMPTVHEIGVRDAAEALSGLAAFSNDPGIWSGNILLSGLGDSSFFHDNIIADPTNTYDLFAAVQAAKSAGSEIFNISDLADLFALFWEQGLGGSLNALGTATQMAFDGREFLISAYGASPIGGLLDLAPTDFITGSDSGSDHIGDVQLGGDQFLHGGGGNNVLIGTLGQDLMDGGAGKDTASFVDISEIESKSTHFYLTDDANAAIWRTGIVSTDTPSDFASFENRTTLYDIETVVLGNFDDIAFIDDISARAAAAGLTIDGGANGEFGDTINLERYDSQTNEVIHIYIDLADSVGTLTHGTLTQDGKSIDLYNFENVTGSAYDDVIHGSQALNHLVGGGGDDELHAGPVSLGGGNVAPTSAQTRGQTISLTLAQSAAYYAEQENSPMLDAPEGYRRIDFTDADILEGGSGDDSLYVYPLPPGVSASDTNPDGNIFIADRVLLMGGEGNDTYIITPGVRDGQLETENINIYDSDGTGRIFVGGYEISNQLLEGWWEGDDGQGDGSSFYNLSNFDEIVEGWHVGYNTSVRYLNGDLLIDVIRMSDPNLPEQGPPLPEYGAEDDEWTHLIIRDFRPGDFGITFGIFFESVIAGASGPEARDPDEVATLDINGTGAGETVNGTTGRDTLNGNDGDDILVGGLGGDKLNVGAGIDWASYAMSAAAVSVSLASGHGMGGDAEGDTLGLIERLEGSAFADTLEGDDGANWLAGRAGADTLRGNGGVDTLHGGTGADILDGGADFDWAYYVHSTSAVTINLETGAASGGEAAGDTFISIERVDGSGYNDGITGDAGDNWLRGRAGTDTLTGGNGNDTLEGGLGADVLNGGGGTDWARYVESQSGVIVSLVTNTGSGGEAQGDTLSGIERLDGSEFADTLTGASGVNWLRGRGGADVLKGGTGNDVLFGGEDADIFRFAATDGHDEIRDWEDGLDRIDLASTALTFASLTITATAAGHALISMAAAHDILVWNAAGQIGANDFLFAAA